MTCGVMERECTPICPSCGYDLEHDSTISLGALEYDPRADIYWHGKQLDLTQCERTILGALVKEAGRAVSPTVLDERIGHDGDGNVPQAMISRLRSKMRAIAEPPIETMRGIGYRWRLG